MHLLLACTPNPTPDSADTGNPNHPPVVEWAFASIVTGEDTTMEVIVSDADGGSDIAGVVVEWVLGEVVTATVEQEGPSEHADGRVYWWTRHASVSPYDGYRVVAEDVSGARSEAYVVGFGGGS